MPFHTFDEMVRVLAHETPHALILDWWRRMEDLLGQLTQRYYGRRFNASKALTRLQSDAWLATDVATVLHSMRRIRNIVAHGRCFCISAEDAALYAAIALHLGGIVGNTEPDDAC